MRQKPRIKQGIQFVQTDQINGQLSHHRRRRRSVPPMGSTVARRAP